MKHNKTNKYCRKLKHLHGPALMIIKHHYHNQYSANCYAYPRGHDYNYKYKLRCSVMLSNVYLEKF